MAQYPAIIDLSGLDGGDGFRIDGAAAGDRSGRSVASAGDVNGDGFADLIVGAYLADPHGIDSGASYVIFGKAAGFAAALDLSALDGTDGFQLSGAAAGDHSGRTVASAGDVNGDGIGDLIIGAEGADPHGGGSGSSYVVFGTTSGFDATLDLSALDGTDGFRLDGAAAGDYSGWSVASAGDVNGDGVADMIVGAFTADPHGDGSGSSYVVFGKTSSFDAALDLSALDGTDGFRLDGAAAGDGAGGPVASAGDINGDGLADLIVAAPGADPHGIHSGSSYVVFGSAARFDATLDLSALDGTNGFRLDGVAAGDNSGISVASAGDVNGDGVADLIVGAPDASPHGTLSGSSYVVFGKTSGFDAVLDLSALNGTDGFRMDGASAYDAAGWSSASAGDVNGDGFDDMIVGAYGADPHGSYSGSSYVVFGKASGFTATLDLSALDGTDGFRLDGVAADDYSGWSVASAGDVNGDGLDDLIMGAPGDHVASAGSSYVVYGRLPDAAVNRTGTVASQHLVGGDFGDRLAGRGGDDALWGHGGADQIYGNIGDDTLLGGDGNDRMQGAAGDDLLTGGAGRDAVTGGVGNDIFVFAAAGDSVDGGRDHIRDFTSGEDRIDLHLIDADTTVGGDQAFHLGSGPRFTGDVGELVVRAVGADTVVLGDVDGDSTADFAFVLVGAHVLTSADFIL